MADWKLVKFFIGGNDLCSSCKDALRHWRWFTRCLLPSVLIGSIQCSHVHEHHQTSVGHLESPYVLHAGEFCHCYQCCRTGRFLRRHSMSISTEVGFSRLISTSVTSDTSLASCVIVVWTGSCNPYWIPESGNSTDRFGCLRYIWRFHHCATFIHGPHESTSHRTSTFWWPVLPDRVDVLVSQSSGLADFSYFAPDCFHFSQKGHEAAAVELWNNMVSGVLWPILPHSRRCSFIFSCKKSARKLLYGIFSIRWHVQLKWVDTSNIAIGRKYHIALCIF